MSISQTTTQNGQGANVDMSHADMTGAEIDENLRRASATVEETTRQQAQAEEARLEVAGAQKEAELHAGDDNTPVGIAAPENRQAEVYGNLATDKVSAVAGLGPTGAMAGAAVEMLGRGNDPTGTGDFIQQGIDAMNRRPGVYASTSMPSDGASMKMPGGKDLKSDIQVDSTGFGLLQRANTGGVSKCYERGKLQVVEADVTRDLETSHQIGVANKAAMESALLAQRQRGQAVTAVERETGVNVANNESVTPGMAMAMKMQPSGPTMGSA